VSAEYISGSGYLYKTASVTNFVLSSLLENERYF
jgi:hypothetical protein